MKPLKLGVVGVGHIGRLHARLAAAMQAVELVGVVDPDQAAREQIAQSCHTKALARHGDLLGQVDAAIIAAPTALHHRLGSELIENGIHVLMEKPLAASYGEAAELVALAEKRGVVLQVGHVERFNPALSSVAAHLSEPKYIDARRLSAHKFRSTDIGVVLDLMIHDLDVVLTLVRSPVRDVEALGISIFGRNEDVAQARLRFDNGCVAMLTASRVSYETTRTMHVWSQHGFASVDFGNRCATLVRPSEPILRRQLDVARLGDDEQAHLRDHLFDELLPIERVQSEPCDQLGAELSDFVDSIRQGRSPRVTGVAGRDVIGVAEQILTKISTHAWDGSPVGRMGPFAAPGPAILRGPHWALRPTGAPAERRQAG